MILFLRYFFLAGAIIIALFITDTTDNPVRKQVTVIDKMEVGVGGKSAHENHLYLIAKIGDGKPFEILVTPAAFSTSNIGEDYIFQIEPKQFDPNYKRSVYDLVLIIWILSLGVVSMSILFYAIMQIDKDT